MRLCQYDAHPSFMILVSICGMKYCASSWTMVRRSFSHSAEVRVVVADEEQQVLVRHQRRLAQVGLDVLLRSVDAVERIGPRRGGVERGAAGRRPR